jgi:hypothetical protein
MFPSGGGKNGYSAVRPSVEADADSDIETEEACTHRRILLESALRVSHGDEDAQPSTGDLADIYLGALNVYTTPPQFVGAISRHVSITGRAGQSHQAFVRDRPHSPPQFSVPLPRATQERRRRRVGKLYVPDRKPKNTFRPRLGGTS